MALRVWVETVRRRNAAGKQFIGGYRVRYIDNSDTQQSEPGVWEKQSDATDVRDQVYKRLIDGRTGRIDPRASLLADLEKFVAECRAGTANKKGRRLKESTIASYRQNLKPFLAEFQVRSQIDEERLRDWITAQSGEGNAEHTFANRVKDAKTFLNWLYRRKLINVDPDFISIARPECKPRYFTDAEINALEKAAEGGPFHLALRLGYKAGLRKSEILRFDMRDVRFLADGRAELSIWSDVSKNKRNRTVPLSPAIVELLGTRRQGLIYPWKSRRFEYAWWKLKAKARIQEPAKWMTKRFKWGEAIRDSEETESAHFHDLRHTFCRIFLESGAGDLDKLARITGHESLDVLRRTYGHFRSFVLHRAIDTMEARPQYGVERKIGEV